MPSIFKNFNSDKPRKKIIREAIENGGKAKLYTKFIEFYKKNCTLAERIYFLTGRKFKEFGKFTEKQLQILTEFKDFHVIYYPERKSYKSRQYFAWKVKEIRKIIKESIKKVLEQEILNEKFKFYIFDDMNEYFPEIRSIKEILNHQLQLIVIESENNWNILEL
jgi:hypothetical protein